MQLSITTAAAESLASQSLQPYGRGIVLGPQVKWDCLFKDPPTLLQLTQLAVSSVDAAHLPRSCGILSSWA